VLVAVASVALTTLLVSALKDAAPVVSLGVLYLLGVLLVSSVWGARLGVAAAVASALAFNYFHIPPTGRFTIAQTENWVALAVFLVVAVVASSLAESARARAAEAEERRGEADLSAELARLLLRGDDLHSALATAAQRLAAALGLPSAALESGVVEPGEGRMALALHDGARQIGTLLLPAGLPGRTLRRVHERIVPALESLLAAGVERDAMLSERVETSALRRSDVLKTALLRAVSHDLRSPLTAIRTAAEPLQAERIAEDDRREMGAVVAEETERLSRLIDKLLDLSRLEADTAEPRPEWCSLDEVVHAAIDSIGIPQDAFRVQLADAPPVRADAAQLELAFANLLENAARYSGGHPVLVRGGPAHDRILVRIVDRGPGIPVAEQKRIFEPFHRLGPANGTHRGAGLGLAIARGFLEVNGGRVSVESLPGQGAAFVVQLPLAPVPG
jgi:two-component system sensor histidine kinase KdpD